MFNCTESGMEVANVCFSFDGKQMRGGTMDFHGEQKQ